MNDSETTNLEAITRFRRVDSCKRHIQLSATLAEQGHPGARWSNQAIYWATECDDCAQHLLNYVSAKLETVKNIAMKYADEADHRSRSGVVSASHEALSCSKELDEVKL